MQNVDIGKIIALKKAGWKIERIAAEMHIEPDTVNKAISGHMELEKKKTDAEQDKEADRNNKEVVIISLSSEQLKEIYEKSATIGAKEAWKIFKQERRKEFSSRADRRLRNTKLLLHNYHMLKEHAENSVFGRTQMEESAIDILESMLSVYDNEVIIESIKRSATRTAIIISHIETMFGLYEAYCDNAPNRDVEMRRYNVVWDMYVADNILSAEEIADKQHISVRTVYEDVKVATERLSALIFGVDGLKVH